MEGLKCGGMRGGGDEEGGETGRKGKEEEERGYGKFVIVDEWAVGRRWVLPHYVPLAFSLAPARCQCEMTVSPPFSLSIGQETNSGMWGAW